MLALAFSSEYRCAKVQPHGAASMAVESRSCFPASVCIFKMIYSVAFSTCVEVFSAFCNLWYVLGSVPILTHGGALGSLFVLISYENNIKWWKVKTGFMSTKLHFFDWSRNLTDMKQLRRWGFTVVTRMSGRSVNKWNHTRVRIWKMLVAGVKNTTRETSSYCSVLYWLMSSPFCSCRESCTGGGGGGRWRLRHVLPVILLCFTLHRHGRNPARPPCGLSFWSEQEMSGQMDSGFNWPPKNKLLSKLSNKEESIHPAGGGGASNQKHQHKT